MRINKHFSYIQILQPAGSTWLLFGVQSQKWMTPDEQSKEEFRNWVQVKTLRAAVRKIRRWARYLPVGTQFMVVNKYHSHVVIKVKSHNL